MASARAIAAPRTEEFGALAEIDFHAARTEKLDVNISRYTIPGGYNPSLAHLALEWS